MTTVKVRQLVESSLITSPENSDLGTNGSNVHDQFEKFRQSLVTSGPLTYKSHVQHILAASGILLLGRHQHPDLLKFIDEETISTMSKGIQQKILPDRQRFPRATLVEIMDIIQRTAAEEDISTNKAVQLLLSLVDEENDHYSNKVILCFKSFVEQLPMETFELEEMELSTRLIQPLLQTLFEDKEESTYFRWTNTQTEENRDNESALFEYASWRLHFSQNSRNCKSWVFRGQRGQIQKRYGQDQQRLV